MTLGTLGWTTLYSVCGSVTYNLYVHGTTTTPDSIFSLTPTNVLVQTTTGDTSKVNSY